MVSEVRAEPREPGPLRLRDSEFAPGRPLVMAIVNRTPDSFYRPGLTWDSKAALDHVHQVIAKARTSSTSAASPPSPGKRSP